ncbi:hypothetical protein IPG36_06540 [bacterium]|nr:MAG: hypothetical protein IPG36_06540 [bacterium]
MAVNFGHGEAAMVNPTPTATVATTTTATKATTVSASYQDGTYTGATASHKFGSVQVSVTIKSGKITAVDIPVLPMGDHESADISDYASSELVDLTLAAQSSTFERLWRHPDDARLQNIITIGARSGQKLVMRRVEHVMGLPVSIDVPPPGGMLIWNQPLP